MLKICLWLLVINHCMLQQLDDRTFLVNIIVPDTWDATNDPNNSFYQPYLVYMEAAVFAINQVNSKTDFLYGYKMALNKVLGHDVADAHPQDITTILTFDTLITYLFDVPIIIGPNENLYSSFVEMADSTETVMVSYGATTVSLEYESTNIFKTVPSDRFRMQALLDLLTSLGWNYFNLATSEAMYINNDTEVFKNWASDLNLCIREIKMFLEDYDTMVYRKYLRKSYDDVDGIAPENDYREFLRNSYEDGIKGIIAFTNPEDSLFLLKELRALIIEKNLKSNPFKIIWFYGAIDFLYFSPPMSDHVHILYVESISIELTHAEHTEFKNFMESRYLIPSRNQSWYSEENAVKYYGNVSNTYYKIAKKYNFMQKHCRITRCSDVPYNVEWFTTRRPYTEKVLVNYMIHAIYASAMAIRTLIEKKCDTSHLTYFKCEYSPANVSNVRKELFNILRLMSYPDNTISSTVFWDNYTKPEIISYDFVYHNPTKRAFKSNKVGVWSINRTNSYFKNENVLGQCKRNFLFDHSKTWVGFNFTPICSKPCDIGYIKEHANDNLKICCWSCIKCPFNSIVINNTCVMCQLGLEKAELETMTCSRLPKKKISFFTFPYHLSVLALLTIFVYPMNIFCLVIVFRYFDSKIFRKGRRALWIVYLIGIFFQITAAILYLNSATYVLCILRSFFSQTGSNICFLTILLKLCVRLPDVTKKAVKQFAFAREPLENTSQISRSPKSNQTNCLYRIISNKTLQVIVLLLLSVVPFTCIHTNIGYFTVVEVGVDYTYSTDVCGFSTRSFYFHIVNAVCFFFIILSMGLQIRNKQFLDMKYNEGWSFVFTTSVSFFITIVFSVAFAVAKFNYFHKDIASSFFYLLRSYTFLGFIFVPKLCYFYKYRDQIRKDNANRMKEKAELMELRSF